MEIKCLVDKDPGIINFIIDELLKPEIKFSLFDEHWSRKNIIYLLYNSSTIIYGLFRENKLEPFGTVFFTGIYPGHDGTVWMALFNEEDRKQGISIELCNSIKIDLLSRYQIHSVSTEVTENPEIEKTLKEMGFEKIGVKRKCKLVSGKGYKDISIYYYLVENEH